MAFATINKGASYFNTVLWTGDGTNNRSITGVGFRPEFAWTKRRDGGQGNTNHNLWNFVVGAGNNAELASNTLGAEGASGASEYGYISALNSDGFTLTDGTDATYKNIYTNNSGGTYVSWNWLANGTGVSNTAGSISSTISANTTSGFSIVSYTGTGSAATVGHGLGVAPKMIIFKNRGNAVGWACYNSNLGNTNYIALNESIASEAVGSVLFNSTSPTSSVFSIGTGDRTNSSSVNYIAYCFAEVKGYSKFGSYTGNGSADGTFVYTGFKPAFLIVKRYNDAGYDWLMYDNKRQFTFNVVDDFLNPNLSAVETTGNANQSLDFLSNGVKFRGSGASSNGSGASYIYMAFAENPFVLTDGTPVTAR